MKTFQDKTQKSESKSTAKNTAQKQINPESPAQFIDQRPQAAKQRILQGIASQGLLAQRAVQLQEMANANSIPQDPSSNVLQGQFDTIQRKEGVVQRVKTRTDLGALGPAADDNPIPIGDHLKTLDHGHNILQRLGNGERTALEEIGVKAPIDYEMQTHEWGLGFDKDVGLWVIVRGGPGAVSFGSGILENVTGISHTHPLPSKGAELPDMGEDDTFLDRVEFSKDVGIDMVFGGFNSVLPSNTDVIANYTVGSKQQEWLFTPYRLDNKGQFSKSDKDPLVTLQFGPTVAPLKDLDMLDREVGEAEAVTYYFAPIIIYCGEKAIWKGCMQVATDKSAMAWLKSESAPDNANHRSVNEKVVSEHNIMIKLKEKKLPEKELLKEKFKSEILDMNVTEKQEFKRFEHDFQEMEPVQIEKVVKDKKGKKGSGEKKKGCFITTACVEALGLPDDCYELTTLRAFRDGFMNNLPKGSNMIAEYYAIAPLIVERIQAEANAQEILTGLYGRILQSVRWIEVGEEDKAMQNYVAVVKELRDKYLQTPASSLQ